ncbi:MAG: ribonuclease Z [Candidatus Marsarchaeota archaeon]|jgi:ribonuclease Z|nr:ribonuclease Z [Candidatus Marsarchaeota archaeon]MCL5111904.1 ribonuclease Z [Candidatus Marsarchaeota archaeon]
MPLPINITFLGTAGSTPTKERGLPSVAMEYDGNVYIFDCGEGAQRQLMVYGISPYRIKAIFITHMHGDHVIGVAGLVRTLALNRRTDPLYIYVPRGEESKVTPLLTFDRAMMGYEVKVVGVKSGEVLKGRGFSVSAFRLRHSIPTYGYVFKENDRYKFDKEKCRRLGIKGEVHSKLLAKGSVKIGNRTVRLKDVAVEVPGRKVVYAADTRPVSATVEASRSADIVIHEATYTNELKKFAKERLHSTAAECAEIAKDAKAKRLIIFHISARYKRPDELLKEARAVFKNTDAAYDGMRITI